MRWWESQPDKRELLSAPAATYLVKGSGVALRASLVVRAGCVTWPGRGSFAPCTAWGAERGPRERGLWFRLVTACYVLLLF